VRDLVLFATHNLLRDPPFSRIDLISCRNLLIYLDRDLQQQVISTFNYAMLPKGYLFLGSSESAEHPAGLFRLVDRDARIYQSLHRISDRLPNLPKVTVTPPVTDWPVARPPARNAPSEGILHRHALEALAPPSILVDEAHHIVHISETAGRYLLHPAGPPTSDITELIRPELRLDLRSALHRALEQGQTNLSLPIPVRFNGSPQRVYLHVKPVTGEDRARTALVLFIEGALMEQPLADKLALEEDRSADDTIQQLRDELLAMRSRLKASREEEESANEELRAANEELQSINEEYRSTAEELETSKEELQSINEELQTLNNELKLKLESVSQAHNDLQNWMAATDVGTLFLDNQLRIKRFTPHVASFFNITENDEGRPITDFTHRLKYGNLTSDARTVLSDLVPIEREVESGDGKWFIIRFRPYRTMDDKIEGVVVTFVDFTQRRSAEAALHVSQTRLQLARDAADIGIQDYDPVTNEFWLDDRAAKFWGLPAEHKAPADAIWSRIYAEDLQVVRSAFEAALDPAGAGHFAAEFRLASRAQDECWIRATGKALFVGDRGDKHAERLVVTAQDISEWKLWDRRQRLIVKELTHRVKNTLAVVQSMARQTFHNSKDIKAELTSFEGRLHALSRAHDLLLQENWNGAGLRALVTSQLGAQLVDGHDRVEISGPEVMLPGRLATPFGLFLHELATNALKYGSLSNETGRVTLDWQLKGNAGGNVLKIKWVEKDGPRPQVQEAGFGSYIIDNGLPGAQVKREFRPEGMICTVSVSLGNMNDA
jgi:two-component system CheB/CheR fusion protein